MTLELDAQGELPGAVAGVLRRLRRAQDAEGCRHIDLRDRRSEVGVVEHICKCGFEAHSYSFRNLEDFGETEAGRNRAWSLEDADSGVAETAGTGRRGRKGGEVEVLCARLSLIEIRRDLVGTQVSAAIDHVGVGLIVGIADARCEPRTGFKPSDSTYTVFVRATDTLLNTTTNPNLVSAEFQIQTIPPPAPTIIGPPSNPSTNLSPEFTLADTEASLSYYCIMDGGSPVYCNGDTDHDDDPGVQAEWQYENLSPGPHCFSAYTIDGAGNQGATTKFCWTVVGKPASITVSSGSPQSTTVHAAFAAPLVAKVSDSLGTGVPGVIVTFTAPGSGASGSFASCAGGNPSNGCRVTTNSSGLATSAVFTANTIAGGPYTVTATTSAVSGSANFSLTNNPGGASQLVFTSGAVSGKASQSATLGPITLQVTDSYGNVVNVAASTTVNLSSTSTGGIYAITSGGPTVTLVTIPAGGLRRASTTATRTREARRSPPPRDR